MNYFYLLLVGLFFISCTSNKSEEVLIKDLKRATVIIKDKNLSTLEKVENFYLKDTKDKTAASLYKSLKAIQQYKDAYLIEILKEENTDFEKANSDFLTKCFALLTKEEKEDVLKTMKDSPLFDSALLQEINQSKLLSYELALEAEIFIQETYKVILKDFSKKKHRLDWDVYYYGEK